MKKEILKALIIISTAILLAVYLLSAFIVWQFNPKYWSISTRAICVFSGVFFSGIAFEIFLCFFMKKKTKIFLF